MISLYPPDLIHVEMATAQYLPKSLLSQTRNLETFTNVFTIALRNLIQKHVPFSNTHGATSCYSISRFADFCGTRQMAAARHPLNSPCSTCGAKHRVPSDVKVSALIIKHLKPDLTHVLMGSPNTVQSFCVVCSHDMLERNGFIKPMASSYQGSWALRRAYSSALVMESPK